MEYIKIEQRDQILIMTIDRVAALNALSKQVLSEIKEAMEGIDVNVTRCVILTGAGKAFVAGADVSEMQSMTKAQAEDFGLFGNKVFRLMEKTPVPIIAAINGFALGGGCELAMSCDIRIASEKAVFAQPEVGLGITAGFGGTQRLPRIVGEGKAKQMLYTGEKVTAAQALEIGLVTQVHPAEQLMDKALELAAAIVKNAPIAVRATKIAIEEGRSVDLDAAVAIEAKYFGGCFESWDQREGMSALLEKRKPDAFQNK